MEHINRLCKDAVIHWGAKVTNRASWCEQEKQQVDLNHFNSLSEILHLVRTQGNLRKKISEPKFQNFCSMKYLRLHLEESILEQFINNFSCYICVLICGLCGLYSFYIGGCFNFLIAISLPQGQGMI